VRNILAEANRPALEHFVRPGVLLAFDFDGTLAPLVRDPARAQLRASTRVALQRVARRYPCIVISGRTRADAKARLRGTGVESVVGNHGAEGSRQVRGLAATVDRWRPVLHRALDGIPGVSLEDKRYSLTVHFDGGANRRRVREHVAALARSLGGVRLLGGRNGLNVLPARAPHKGIALASELARARCDRAVYVGDDITDEDVFAVREPERFMTIRVGRRRGSAATYYITRQREIDRLLRVLAHARPALRR